MMLSQSISEARDYMVDRQIAARGVRSELVLAAMRKVPREKFLPEGMVEFAYDDSPLPIAAGQTISQPYIVAFMTEALALTGGEKVLEIGAGCGYAAAVLAEIADQVYTVERLETLARTAGSTLERLGYHNVHVKHGDGTLGWPEHAPFDAIIVSAGGPDVPQSLKDQLAIGGRLVIPVGCDQRTQELIRITRVSEEKFVSEDIADVRFVPLIGAQGWSSDREGRLPRRPRSKSDKATRAISDACEPFLEIETANLEPLLDRIGDSRVVLIGEASHGTSEFYEMRARITQELITRGNFDFVAIEGDWPDAARIDHYVRQFDYPPSEWTAFARFPTWMWRNNETRQFVEWLRDLNHQRSERERVAFHGLDLYSLYSSVNEVLRYLDKVDPAAAQVARVRYGCLTPWQADPATYGHAAITGSYRSCEADVVRMLKDLLHKGRAYAEQDGQRFLDAVQNARLVANAERYYRVMYYGSRESWNLRDQYMFETLQSLLDSHGPKSRGIVWAHNSHIGDAAMTEMSARGEFNVGQLCREAFGDSVYAIGFGTHTGTVAAASEWDGPMEVKDVVPSHGKSHEHIFHSSAPPRCMLGLRRHASRDVEQIFSTARLERAIGVIYRPETELASHYFEAMLAHQFDEYIWLDETTAVHPFDTSELEGMPDTYPFGL
jgi:protein-L-isoaspartate(D-aspartate) O-methyltransferase